MKPNAIRAQHALKHEPNLWSKTLRTWPRERDSAPRAAAPPMEFGAACSATERECARKERSECGLLPIVESKPAREEDDSLVRKWWPQLSSSAEPLGQTCDSLLDSSATRSCWTRRARHLLKKKSNGCANLKELSKERALKCKIHAAGVAHRSGEEDIEANLDTRARKE